jgi:hypothetical protein
VTTTEESGKSNAGAIAAGISVSVILVFLLTACVGIGLTLAVVAAIVVCVAGVAGVAGFGGLGAVGTGAGAVTFFARKKSASKTISVKSKMVDLS